MNDLHEDRTPLTAKNILFFCALVAAGIAGNYFRYEIVFSVQFIFGSVFAMLALQLFGPGAGVLAGALISSSTYLLWNHPYAIITMTAEVLAVGLLTRRNKAGFVVADALYWLVLGMPLVVLFYAGVMHLPLYNALITMLKQAVNGIANALLARLAFIAAARQWQREPVSMREVLFNLLLLSCLLPSLFLIARAGASDLADVEQSARRGLILSSQRVERSINDWLGHHIKRVEQLAWMAAYTPVSSMQKAIDRTRESDDDFLRLGLLNADATIIAYSPLVDELGQRNIGRNFKDRPFIPILKRTLEPMLSEVVMGRIGKPRPMVTALAPVVVRGRYAGYMTGILNLDRVDSMISDLSQGATLPERNYVLVDRNGNVIVGSNKSLPMMKPYVREPGDVSRIDDAVSLWLPRDARNISISDHWKKACYFIEIPTGGLSGWRLILEQPMAPFQKMLYERYAAQLAWVFGTLLAALIGSEVLSRRFTGALESLARISSGLPDKLIRREPVPWPRSNVRETRQLVANLEDMAGTITRQFDEIRAMNETLEQRIAERTQELKESEERFRSLFEKVHVVSLVIDPDDGAIINANPAAERYYGWSVEELKAMRISDVNMLSRSAVQEEMEQACCEKRNYFIFRHRKADGTVRDVEVYSGPIEVRGRTLLYSIVHDITERRRAEEQLRKQAALLDLSPAAIMTRDGESRITYWNREAEEMYGWTAAEAMGAVSHELLTTEFPVPRTEIENSIRREKFWEGELVHRRRDGAALTVASRWALQHDAAGNADGYLEVNIDISERKRAEQELWETTSLLRTFMNSIDESAFLMDISGRILAANETLAKRLGRSQRELVGMRMEALLPPAVARKRREHVDELVRTRKPVRFEDERMGRVIDNALYPVFDSSGQVVALSVVGTDITERKYAEQERERLIAELQKAIAEIKTLHGILPICSHCKKIRDEKGAWHQLEAYISQHTDSQFSHGLCADCAKKMYPDYFKDK